MIMGWLVFAGDLSRNRGRGEKMRKKSSDRKKEKDFSCVMCESLDDCVFWGELVLVN